VNGPRDKLEAFYFGFFFGLVFSGVVVAVFGWR